MTKEEHMQEAQEFILRALVELDKVIESRNGSPFLGFPALEIKTMLQTPFRILQGINGLIESRKENK